MDKRTIGWLISEFGVKLGVFGMAVYAAAQAAHFIHTAFAAMGDMPL